LARTISACAIVVSVLFAFCWGVVEVASAGADNDEKKFQIWSSAATIAGAGFASATIALALISYWGVQRSARLAHMHALFRELMKFEHERRDWRTGVEASAVDSLSTTGLILYSLEEISDAVDQEARFALLPKRKRFIADWRRTIRSHIRSIPSVELSQHLNAHADCYGKEFLLQVAEWSGAKRVKSIVEHELSQRPRKDPNMKRDRYRTLRAKKPTVADATVSKPLAEAGSE